MIDALRRTRTILHQPRPRAGLFRFQSYPLAGGVRQRLQARKLSKTRRDGRR